jgi:hypothetical protein
VPSYGTSFDGEALEMLMVASTPDTSANKVAFVLSLPFDARPTDVVAKAKEAGISISASYVSRIQSSARTQVEGAKSSKVAVRARSPTVKKKAGAKRPTRETVSKPPAKRAAKRTPKTTTAEMPLRKMTPAENLLRAVAAEIGIGRAIQILEAEHQRVTAILRR